MGVGVLFQLDREGGDDEAKRLWQKLKPKIPEFFSGLDVKPSLLHGDLWSGNAGQADGRPGKNFALFSSHNCLRGLKRRTLAHQ